MYILLIYEWDENQEQDFVSEAFGPFPSEEYANSQGMRLGKSWSVMKLGNGEALTRYLSGQEKI